MAFVRVFRVGTLGLLCYEPGPEFLDEVRVVFEEDYVVIAATYTFEQKGKAMHEPAQMTFAMKKVADGWKIAGWTWTGPLEG